MNGDSTTRIILRVNKTTNNKNKSKFIKNYIHE